MRSPGVFAAPVRALVRGVPTSYARCLRSDPAPVDPERARAQVEGYARALAACGVLVETLPADESCPDACFVEDTAVVLDAETAFVTRPGAPSRRPELPPVAAKLRERLHLESCDEAGTIDGGDVLRIGDTLLVGLSERTDGTGARALARAARARGIAVVTVPVGAGLHLKSAMTFVSPGCVVALPRAPGLDSVRALGARIVEAEEEPGANVLALGRTVLVSTAAPNTRRKLEREPGIEVRPIDVSELHKGDGALTCLSLRVPAPGAWCA
jgi:dimethylargininase